MKHSKIMGMLLLCLSLYVISYADKMDTKGTILNSNCKPIGTRCGKGSTSKDASLTYVYNEPRQGSFSLQFTEEEVLKNEELAKVLVDKDEFDMEEAMQIPVDIIEALKMPEDYVVEKGTYPVEFSKGIYKVIFHK